MTIPDFEPDETQGKSFPTSHFDIGQELEVSRGLELSSNVERESYEPLSFDKKKLSLILFAMLLSLLVSTLVNTIISTSLVRISSDFNSLNQITWVAASYLLTETAVQSLYGKLSDLFGRKIMFTLALVFFLVGSIGCGFSRSLLSLVILGQLAELVEVVLCH